jgi:hypothetical protein
MALIGGITGCNRAPHPTFPVEGIVKFADGSPLEGGWIECVPKDGPRVTARGEIRPDGTFRLRTFDTDDGAVAGTLRVIVNPPLMGKDIDEGGNIRRATIHPKHLSYETSGLEFTVAEDAEPNFWEVVVERPPK